MTIHEGGCHCGAIVFTVEGTIETAIDCNCSLCRRRGALLAFYPREALVLRTPEADMGTYSFNSHRLQHHFCPNCGIHTYGEGATPDGTLMAAINLRCVEDLDLDALVVKHFNGRAV